MGRMTIWRVGKLSVALAVLGFVSAVWAWSAAANPVPVDGKDPKDGTDLTGFRLQSMDGKAFLYFLCDAGDANPELWITHGHEIGASTQPFRVTYSIDGGPVQEHWFYVMENLKSGAFFPRYNQMYEARFGPTPEMFDKEAGSVSPEYVDWYNNIYNTLIADFGFGGTTADFTIIDTEGNSHGYQFNLIPLRDSMARLKRCYEPPVNYTPISPSG
ncbi:hypothetical protein KAJ83_12525 [Marivibrio halodurans]|uniref:Uncharacterized protein n=1 Tax=Marivibrio halodurans TaxID=2039722 RepID=A0A8J7RZZ8_9PROT|nr:hypothetical protein [Marivibrio halodurans]MBP5857837.1 hypothetical protein [Marivibrio halodurans]